MRIDLLLTLFLASVVVASPAQTAAKPTSRITTKPGPTATNARATTPTATTKKPASPNPITDFKRLLGLAEDFGYIVHNMPAAAFCPDSAEGVAAAVQWALANNVKISVRGHGHSTYGQSQAVSGGAVIDSACLNTITMNLANRKVIAGAGATWREVTVAAGRYGLRPYVVTDASMLTVGGTISLGGAGHLSPTRGFIVDNVLELVVVTGLGAIVTCSPTSNAELFNAVLGGQGQAAIIVSATVPLEKDANTVSQYYFFYNSLTAFISALPTMVSQNRFEGATGTSYANNPVGLISNIQPQANPALKTFFNSTLYKQIFVISALDLDGNFVIPPTSIAAPIFRQKNFSAYALQAEQGFNSLRYNPPYLLYQPRANMHAITAFDTPQSVGIATGWIQQLLAFQTQNPFINIAMGVIGRKPLITTKSNTCPMTGVPANATVTLNVNILSSLTFADPTTNEGLSPWAVTAAYNAAFTQAFQGLLQAAPQARLYPWNIRPETIPGFSWAAQYGGNYAKLQKAKRTFDPKGILGAGAAVFS